MIEIASVMLWFGLAFAYSARNDAKFARQERDDYYEKWRNSDNRLREEMIVNKELRAELECLKQGKPYR